jgi:hypothetical protein
LLRLQKLVLKKQGSSKCLPPVMDHIGLIQWLQAENCIFVIMMVYIDIISHHRLTIKTKTFSIGYIKVLLNSEDKVYYKLFYRCLGKKNQNERE